MRIGKLSIILIILAGFFAQDLLAIPAFARKYRLSCRTCHTPFPTLKPYGDDFAGNGFVLADEDAPGYYVDTGDDELSLIRDFPLAVRLDAFVTYKDQQNREMADFQTPYLIKLLSGGEIADDIAYYFYAYLSERGEVAGVEDAYIMFNDLFDIDLDLYVGQFQVSDPLFKRELRLTLEDYQLYKPKVGLSNSNLAYDRGIMITYGAPTGTDIIAEVVNGNGLGEANGLHEFDNDNYKNFALRVSQDLGEFLRLGGFGYYGQEDLTNNAGTTAKNKFWYAGPDLTLAYKDLIALNVGYLMRNDGENFEAPASTILGKDIATTGYLAELIYTPDGENSKWYGVLLYNKMESDYASLEYETFAGHAGYMLRRNIRLVAEASYDLKDEYSYLSMGIVSAF